MPSNIDLLRTNYSFVILRNPFKRLLSAYCDKICHKSKNKNDSSYENTKSLLGTNRQTSFSEFIDIIWNNPSLKKKDQHFQDQCDFLVYEKYSDYFAFESYDETIEAIHSKTGMSIEDTRPFNSIYTTYNCEKSNEFNLNTPGESIASLMAQHKRPIPELMYNEELIKKVGELYFSDILLYSNAIVDSEQELKYWLKSMS